MIYNQTVQLVFFYQYLLLHTCVQIFDVTERVKKIWNLNKPWAGFAQDRRRPAQSVRVLKRMGLYTAIVIAVHMLPLRILSQSTAEAARGTKPIPEGAAAAAPGAVDQSRDNGSVMARGASHSAHSLMHH
jgi:hypothetical protein